MTALKYGVIKLTDGNIRNNHLYLTSVLDLFPASSIGGGNVDEQATTLLEIRWGGEQPVLTDIAGDKKIFRKRAWVKQFFSLHHLSSDDEVVIEQTGDKRYHIYPRR